MNNISIPARPWEHIPNPFGFPTIGEQLKSVHGAPSPSTSTQTPFSGLVPYSSSNSARTSSAGVDRIGLGFSKGDLLLANSEIYVADEVVLDDRTGTPYALHWRSPLYHEFVVEVSSSKIFNRSFSKGASFLQEVDPDWVPPFLGLVLDDYDYHTTPVGFITVVPQGFRVRARLLSDGQGGKRKSLHHDKVAVAGREISVELYELLKANRQPQYVGPKFQQNP